MQQPDEPIHKQIAQAQNFFKEKKYADAVDLCTGIIIRTTDLTLLVDVFLLRAKSYQGVAQEEQIPILKDEFLRNALDDLKDFKNGKFRDSIPLTISIRREIAALGETLQNTIDRLNEPPSYFASAPASAPSEQLPSPEEKPPVYHFAPPPPVNADAHEQQPEPIPEIQKEKVRELPKEVKREYDPEAEAQLVLAYGLATGDGRRSVNPAEAERLYRLAAEKKHPIAMFWLAYQFHIKSINKQTVEQLLNEAMPHLEMLANEGNLYAQTALGLYHHSGISGVADSTEGVKWFRQAAEQGHSEAQYHLACWFDSQKNYDESEEWYKKSAAQGNVLALTIMGIIYESKEERAEAAIYFQRAAEQEFTHAKKDLESLLQTNPALKPLREYKLPPVSGERKQDTTLMEAAEVQVISAYRLETGSGHSIVNLDEALRLYELAAEQKHPLAMFHVGRLLVEGKRIKKNIASANILFEEAVPSLQSLAYLENPYAQTALGGCYLSGWAVTQSFAEAIRWYQAAADKGDAEAQYIMGWFCNTGQIMTEDRGVKAVEWYRKAADQGHMIARYNLGVLLRCDSGIGIARDLPESEKWNRQAAMQGFSLAQYQMGKWYEIGDGPVLKDLTEAKRWYQLSADQGEVNSQVKLGLCHLNNIPKNPQAAARLFQFAADQKHAIGEYFLAWCYENSKGVDKDLHKAEILYFNAAQRGCKEAQAALDRVRANKNVVQKSAAAQKPEDESKEIKIADKAEPEVQSRSTWQVPPAANNPHILLARPPGSGNSGGASVPRTPLPEGQRDEARSCAIS